MSRYLDQALDLSDEDRLSWLASLHRSDPALACRIEALLDEHRRLGEEGFLDERPSTLPDRPTLIGRRVGAYTFVAPIGEGGMGTVWLAERTDGEIQQKVAVKLLGIGGRRPEWRDRFLRERQLLASLNHPSIVHVIDVGRTDDGQPYLVMEYVEGRPIDAYAAAIPVRDRLQLFLRVCDAVSHAHGRLIVHRDLKPSNILVDAAGEPKLLDFGIAKLLDETGNPTVTLERVLTPSYASPEQFRGAAHTTATDVYSLGAVLYKLLTGRSPHEMDGAARAAEAPTGEIPAATRVNRDLPVDVDYVLRKALRVEPEERYASVEALALDVRALLDSKPVAARSGDALYRTRKFLRRFWVPVATAALVVISLSIGLYVANRERTIAQRRFMDVRQLSNKLLDLDAQIRPLPGSSQARQLIVDTSLEYLQRLAADVGNDSGLALEVGNAYMRVARVQGVPISPSLGQLEQAGKTLQLAERSISSVLASQPTNRTAMLRAAQIAHDQMILARLSANRTEESLGFAQTSAAWLNKFQASPSDRAEATAVLTTYLNVAQQFMIDQQYGETLRLCRRAIDLARAYDRPKSIGTFHWVSAEALKRQGDLDEALTAIRQSVAALTPDAAAVDVGQTMNYVSALVTEGRILGQDTGVNLGRPTEAVDVLERAFRIADQLVHADRHDADARGRLAAAGIELAKILRRTDPRRALEVYDHTLRDIADIAVNTSRQRYEVQLFAGSSYSLRSLGRVDEARRRVDSALRRLAELKMYPADKIYPGSEAEDALLALAEHEGEGGNQSLAADAYDKLLAAMQPAKAGRSQALDDAVHLSGIYTAASRFDRRVGKIAAASALEARTRELWQEWDRKLPNNAFVRRQIESY